MRPRNVARRSAVARPPGIVRRRRRDEPQLQALRAAAEHEPSRRHQQPQLAPRLLAGGDVVGAVGRVLAREHDHPGRAVGRQRLAAPGLVAGLANGRVARQLQGEQGHDPVRGDPFQLVGRLVPEQHEATARTGLAGRGRDLDAQRRTARRACQVAGDRGGRGRDVGRSVDGDRVAAPSLDDDRAPQERADRRGLHVQAPAQQGEPRELRLEVGGAAVQLRAAIDEEPDDAPLQGHRIHPAQLEGGEPGRRHGFAERRQHLAAGLALDEQHGRHTGTRQGDGELLDLGGPRRDDGERRARDDREVAGLERLERRHARLQDPDPADLALRAFGREVRRPEWTSGRKERAVEVVEGRHASLKATRWPGGQPGRRAATRSSSSRPNSRSASTYRSARQTRPT